MRPSLFMLCSILMMVPASPSLAELRVKVVSAGTQKAVRSTINVRVDGGASESLGETDFMGRRTFASKQCAPGMELQAVPLDDTFEQRDDWRPCVGNPVVLQLQPIYSFAVVRNVSFTGSHAPRLEALLLKARDAAKQGDNAEAAIIGNEMTAILRQQGDVATADQFAAITIHSAGAVLKSKGELGDYAVTDYDPVQQRDVTTPQAYDALKTYQAKSGLDVTGRWDFKTIQSLSDK